MPGILEPANTGVPADCVAALFLQDRSALHRYVRRLLRNREGSEDIVQEAFLRTYRCSEKIAEPRAFMFTTARNLVADSWRRNRLVHTVAPAELDCVEVAGSSESLEVQLLATERRHLLEEAVTRLTPQCRAAFALRIFRGCSYKEIAQQLGLSRKTVENHVARGLRNTYLYLRQRYQLM